MDRPAVDRPEGARLDVIHGLRVDPADDDVEAIPLTTAVTVVRERVRAGEKLAVGLDVGGSEIEEVAPRQLGRHEGDPTAADEAGLRGATAGDGEVAHDIPFPLPSREVGGVPGLVMVRVRPGLPITPQSMLAEEVEDVCEWEAMDDVPTTAVQEDDADGVTLLAGGTDGVAEVEATVACATDTDEVPEVPRGHRPLETLSPLLDP